MSDRKLRIKHHKNIQEKIKDKANKLQQLSQNGADEYKQLARNAAELEDNYRAKTKVTKLQEPYVDRLNTTDWEDYERIINEDEQRLSWMGDIYDAVVDQQQYNSEILTSMATSGNVTAGMIDGQIRVFEGSIPADDLSIIEKISLKPTLSDNIYEIEDLILDLFGYETKTFFSEITDEWNITDNENKHSVLLSLRSLIFDKLIDPNNQYSSARWYKAYCATLGERDPKRVFGRIKYFIIDKKTHSDFLSTTIQEVDLNAHTLEEMYKNLTELGKYGGDISEIKRTYEMSIRSFRNILKLRQELFY